MKNQKTMTKILAGVVIAGVTLTVGGQALAFGSKSTSTNLEKPNVQKVQWERKGKDFKGQFSAEGLKAQLDSFVKAGIITADQENKIIAFMQKKHDDKSAEMEKIKNMTAEERKAYFEANKPEQRVDMFQELVTEKIIDQSQADAIKKTMPQKQGRPGHDLGQGFAAQLDNQVKAGTITQSEKDKIVSFLNKKSEERKTEMEKVKAMTDDQRKAYFEAQKSTPRLDLFAELVKENIITQAKADALKKAMPAHEKGGKGHFMMNKNIKNN